MQAHDLWGDVQILDCHLVSRARHYLLVANCYNCCDVVHLTSLNGMRVAIRTKVVFWYAPFVLCHVVNC